MDLWYPPDDQPPLLEWWTPLLLAGSAGRRERVPWPIHLDDFMLMGRVERGSRPDIWIYKHRDSRRELYLDARGQAYKFTRTPNAASYGRFTACDIRRAVYQADLPAFVEPVWYDEPPAPAAGWDEPVERHDTPHPPASDAHPAHRRRRPRPGAARGHLTLIQGGRQAG
jgi:hypothetical protein